MNYLDEIHQHFSQQGVELTQNDKVLGFFTSLDDAMRAIDKEASNGMQGQALRGVHSGYGRD